MLQPEQPSKNKRKRTPYLSIFAIITTLVLLFGSVLLFSYFSSTYKSDQVHVVIKKSTHSTGIATRGTNTQIHGTETEEPETPTATLTSITPTATAQSTVSPSPTSVTATPVSTIAPTPTSSTVSIPYFPYRGIPTLNNPLSSTSGSQGWENFSAHNEFCGLAGGGYEVIGAPWGLDEGNFSCHEEQANFSNFVFEMQINLVSYGAIQGSNDFYVCPGITFDSTGSAGDSTEYSYYVCSNGNFVFSLSPKGIEGIILASGHPASVHQGLYVTNTLAVSASQGHFTLYINGQEVAHVDSAFYSFGHIGCEAHYGYTYGTVRCSNAKVWTI